VPRAATLSVVRAVSRDDVWIGGAATFQWNGDALREARCDDGSALVSDDVFVTSSELWVLGRCASATVDVDDVLRWKTR